MNSEQVCSQQPNRYVVLDGLRGVAALLVLCYHIGEAFATSPVDQAVNHGYLAVDFFFMLSGFVMGKAYDEKLSSRKLSVKGFFYRRLVRLHPMLILGAVFGYIAFAIQGFVQWNGTSVPVGHAVIALFASMLFIPAYSGAAYEVRGYGEMFPLNGPSWSLFFEYIGNVLYVLLLRKLPTKALAAVVVLSAIGLGAFALCNGSGSYNLGVGWTLADYNFLGGFLRLGFSFSAGLLIARVYIDRHIKGAFWICSALIAILLSMPYISDVANQVSRMNAVYDIVCVALVFPILIFVGASCNVNGGVSHGLCDAIGRLSYPVYIIHYPLMYLFYAWVWAKGLSFSQCWPVAVGVIIVSILLAYLALRYYDEPLRGYLSKQRFRSRI